LHFAHSETEWPCEGWEVIKDVVWKICAVHFWNHVMVVHV
jgi:hypothetical protein